MFFSAFFSSTLSPCFGPWVFLSPISDGQWSVGTARPWCVWKLSSWVVASFVIPTWRFRRWGWNLMDVWHPQTVGGINGWFSHGMNPSLVWKMFFFHVFFAVFFLSFWGSSRYFSGLYGEMVFISSFLQISSWMECQCLHAHEVVPCCGLANMSWNVLMPVAGIQNSHQCRNALAEGPWNTEAAMSYDILMPSLMLKGCNHENIKLLWMNRVMGRFYRRTQQRWDANIAKVLWVQWSMHKKAQTCELCKHKAKQDISTCTYILHHWLSSGVSISVFLHFLAHFEIFAETTKKRSNLATTKIQGFPWRS